MATIMAVRFEASSELLNDPTVELQKGLFYVLCDFAFMFCSVIITVSETVSLFVRLCHRSGLPKCSYAIHVRCVHRLDKEHLVHSHESSNLTPQCVGAGRQR